MDQGGVSLICSLLNKNLSVLEFGSGGSTTFFRFGLWRDRKFELRANWWSFHLSQSFCLCSSEYMASWTSVEHDIKWAKRVRSILARLPWGDKVWHKDQQIVHYTYMLVMLMILIMLIIHICPKDKTFEFRCFKQIWFRWQSCQYLQAQATRE